MGGPEPATDWVALIIRYFLRDDASGEVSRNHLNEIMQYLTDEHGRLTQYNLTADVGFNVIDNDMFFMGPDYSPVEYLEYLLVKNKGPYPVKLEYHGNIINPIGSDEAANALVIPPGHMHAIPDASQDYPVLVTSIGGPSVIEVFTILGQTTKYEEEEPQN